MTSSTIKAPVPAVALQKPEAAAALGMSIASFERHVQDDVPVVRRKKLRLYLVTDLQAWAEKNKAMTLEPAA